MSSPNPDAGPVTWTQEQEERLLADSGKHSSQMVPKYHRLHLADNEVSMSKDAEEADEELHRRLANLGRDSAPG